MQNKYVGDIGDFGKYGLLRHLTGMTHRAAYDDALRLGVVWYLFTDKENNSDGSGTSYLLDKRNNHNKYRECDAELYDELHKIVIEESDRRVYRVKESEILPSNTAHYERSLSYPRGETRELRRLRREDWLEGALTATKDARLVFVDPNNGITENAIWYRKRGPKYVFMDDLRQFYQRGQSLIIYHHLARWDKADIQIRHYAHRLRKCLALAHLPWALRYRRGTTRVYFIVPQLNHRDALEERVNAFKQSHWYKQGHFS